MAQITQLYKENKTPEYTELIQYFRQMDSTSAYMQLQTEGMTDAGLPLHVLVIDADKEFDPQKARARNKSILLINNGIHPGEPDGIDACLQYITEFAQSKSLEADLKNMVICIIPVYNIDGMLNRNSTSRVNQDGPESFGFRGNGRNYDLNRDFLKADSRNAMAFTQIFRKWDPDVFIDTHVSNGADYQYVMTLIPTQHNKLGAPLGDYLKNTMLPALYTNMEKAGFPMCPYVNEIDRTPDQGIAGFLDLPRYSTGYTALYNTIGFMPETHMLKPYPQRVESTLAFIRVVQQFMTDDHDALLAKRHAAVEATIHMDSAVMKWSLDKTKDEQFLFNGYTAAYKPSEVSGLERLYYDRNKPYTKPIPFFDTYNAVQQIDLPSAYVIPQAWAEVIEKLKANKVEMQQLSADTTLDVTVYYITNFKTVDEPYEGHYMHQQVEVRAEQQSIRYHSGDYIIKLNQAANNYIVQALEPQSTDGFFAWGYFDAILQQKEWFSDYVFEDLAAEILRNDPALQRLLEEKQKSDPAFAADAWAQLEFVYEHSNYKEKTHRRYPVARW